MWKELHVLFVTFFFQPAIFAFSSGSLVRQRNAKEAKVQGKGIVNNWIKKLRNNTNFIKTQILHLQAACGEKCPCPLGLNVNGNYE